MFRILKNTLTTAYASTQKPATTDDQPVAPTQEPNVTIEQPVVKDDAPFTVQGFIKSFFTQTIGLVIRFIQIGISIIVLGLSSNTENAYSFGANIWSLIVSIFSIVYLILILSFSFFKSGYLNPGAVLIMESFLMVAFFTSFIAQAVKVGPSACSGTVTSIVGSIFYTISFSSSPCKTAKAVIAFNSVAWVLYWITFIIFVVNVVVPLSAKGSAVLFQWTNNNGVKLDLPVLNIKSLGTLEAAKVEDEEAAVGVSEVEHSDAVAETPVIDTVIECPAVTAEEK
ncbi:hypothetical protein WICPIJ_010157 [Wickerhamomyces pijperi]|uniref:MARVEL domain-containing protein n=1 Tax=Wickerhamomyces pijperi TaxID=599730 RepID=A0A9P8PH41_WICPI|nr:hypothetical protein WICPIJ_010157 [Wickerhamomyces pijperi]